MFLTWKIVSYISGGSGAMSSSSFDYCFMAEVTASNLKADKLVSQFSYVYMVWSVSQISKWSDLCLYVLSLQSLPVAATTCTALNKQCQETILVNKEGNSWTVSLRFSESGGMYYITRGWRKLCLDNRCEIGDIFVFNVVGDGKTTLLMCVCPERKKCSELLSKHLSRKSGRRL